MNLYIDFEKKLWVEKLLATYISHLSIPNSKMFYYTILQTAYQFNVSQSLDKEFIIIINFYSKIIFEEECGTVGKAHNIRDSGHWSVSFLPCIIVL